MQTLLVRCVVLWAIAVAVVMAGGSPNGQRQDADPDYTLFARIGVGMRGFTDIDIDQARGRAYVATADGLRVFDTASPVVSEPQGGLKMTGEVEVAPEIGMLFAEIGLEEVGFVELQSLEVRHRVRVSAPDSLVYEPATGELYVFSRRSSRVRILDGRTAEERQPIDLPGWSGRAALWTPGRIYLAAPPREGLFVIDTAERSLTTWPLPARIRHYPDELTLVGDPEGRTLFVADDYAILALDAETGAEVGRVDTRDRAVLAYDPVADVLLAHTSQIGSPERKLSVYRHDSGGLTKVSELDLPVDVQGQLLPTPEGFMSTGMTPGTGVGTTPVVSPLFTLWRRAFRE